FSPRAASLAKSMGCWPSSSECFTIQVKSPTSKARLPGSLEGVTMAPYLLAKAASNDGIRAKTASLILRPDRRGERLFDISTVWIGHVDDRLLFSRDEEAGDSGEIACF